MKNNIIIKKVLTGVLVGFIATAIGAVIWIVLFSKNSLMLTIVEAYQQRLLGAILAAGALVNIGAFFLFLKQYKNYEARGVLIATVIVALFVLFQKFS